MDAAAPTFGALWMFGPRAIYALTFSALQTSGCAFLFTSNGVVDDFLSRALEFFIGTVGSFILKTSGAGSSAVAVTLFYTLWSGTSLQTGILAFLFGLG